MPYTYIDDTIQALKFYTEAIRYEPKTANLYLARSWFYQSQKNYDLALADIKQFIALAPYSAEGYSSLGQIYGLMKRYADALTALEKANKLDPNYKSLAIQAYVEICLGRYEDAANAVQTERVVEVPFSAANGVPTVKCSINGLPLTFVFDTGASDVSISQTEASFMYKNGYLSKKDIVGNSAYITADGSISIGTNIILQKIDFGGLELKAVRASVVGNQRAPLLLG